jgi:hypothetical protein
MFKTPEELRGLLLLAKAARHVQRGLSWLGIKSDPKLLNDIISQGEAILELADEFNRLFATRGWIAHDMINVDAARAAIAAGKLGDWNRADELLAESYPPFVVRMYLNHMRRLRCFRDRIGLAMLAADDYDAGRYHACIPVILALLDGMGQQLVGAGFFRQSARTDKASESFLELGPGLAQLLRTMGASRRRTTTQEITVPYRHGILHGTDLGYGTRVVAAKTWAALFAAGHYAKLVETPTREDPRPGLLETFRGYVDNRKRFDTMQQHIDSWQERSSDELATIIRDQNVLPGTPERAVVDLLKAWQVRNFGAMAKLTTDAAKSDLRHLAGQIKGNLGTPPASFLITEVEDGASAAGWVTATLKWDGRADEEVRIRLLCMIGDDIAPRGMPGSTWLIHSLWPLEAIRWQGTQDNSKE